MSALSNGALAPGRRKGVGPTLPARDATVQRPHPLPSRHERPSPLRTSSPRLSDLLLRLALPPTERDILRLKYGLDDGIPKSLVKVADIIGVKVTRVRGLEQAALRRLRRPAFLERLEEFLVMHP